MVSSELAAMFDLRVWPELLKADMLPASDFSAAEIKANYVARCKDFAKEIGRPWTEVHYPFFISMDNCKKHPWLRRLMLRPRVSHSVLAHVRDFARRQVQLLRDEVALERMVSIERDSMTRSHTPIGPVDEWASMTARTVAGQQQQRGELEQQVNVKLAEFEAKHGCTLEQSVWRELAWLKPWFRTISPEQFMPLVECTPDIHCPVEHMVRTLKHFVRMSMWGEQSDGWWRAVTYQQYLEQAVREKGNGAAGVRHIAGSVRKQPFVCGILAEIEYNYLKIEYTFGGPATNANRPRCSTWYVRARAGDYISETRWT